MIVKNKTLVLNKSNIKKALQGFPPGSCDSIDWKNVEVKKHPSTFDEDGYVEVFIPLKLRNDGIFELTYLDQMVDGMKRSFNLFIDNDSHGLIRHKNRTCMYFVYDI